MITASILAEVGVRVTAPQPMSFARFYAPGTNVGWTLRPDHQEQITTGEYSIQVHVNSLGCRGDEHHFTTADHAASTILILGDSYMFGNGVDEAETTAAQLEVLLRGSSPPGTSFTVLNAGVPGYGPLQYRLRYEHLRNTCRPSIAIIALYIGNDIFDCTWDKTGLTVVDGYLVSRQGSKASSLRFWTKRHSHLYRLLSRVSQQYRTRSGAADKPYHEALVALFVERSSDQSTAESKVWSRFEEEMEHLLRSVRADGVMPLVTFLPMRLQVDESMWERYVAETLVKKGRPRRFFPQERIGRLLDRLDVIYVDLTPAFIERGGGSLFYALDGHWNAEGHRLAASVLAARLQDLLEAPNHGDQDKGVQRTPE